MTQRHAWNGVRRKGDDTPKFISQEMMDSDVSDKNECNQISISDM